MPIPCENVHNTMVSVSEESEGNFERIAARGYHLLTSEVDQLTFASSLPSMPASVGPYHYWHGAPAR
jgi:hypothetical protein